MLSETNERQSVGYSLLKSSNLPRKVIQPSKPKPINDISNAKGEGVKNWSNLQPILVKKRRHGVGRVKNPEKMPTFIDSPLSIQPLELGKQIHYMCIYYKPQFV